jgi:hypothetical protein
MKKLIKNINLIKKEHFKIIASCCGHGKYPMTIIVLDEGYAIWDLVSGINIPRTRNLYKKDKQGYYYIPECSGLNNSRKVSKC